MQAVTAPSAFAEPGPIAMSAGQALWLLLRPGDAIVAAGHGITLTEAPMWVAERWIHSPLRLDAETRHVIERGGWVRVQAELLVAADAAGPAAAWRLVDSTRVMGAAALDTARPSDHTDGYCMKPMPRPSRTSGLTRCSASSCDRNPSASNSRRGCRPGAAPRRSRPGTSWSSVQPLATARRQRSHRRPAPRRRTCASRCSRVSGLKRILKREAAQRGFVELSNRLVVQMKMPESAPCPAAFR